MPMFSFVVKDAKDDGLALVSATNEHRSADAKQHEQIQAQYSTFVSMSNSQE